jgi:hypothetical protein
MNQEKRQMPWRRNIDLITDLNLNGECIRKKKIRFERKKAKLKRKILRLEKSHPENNKKKSKK